MLGCSAEEAARKFLERAAQQVAQAVESLAKEYKLRNRDYQLIGGGGGAGALVPAVAGRLGVPYCIADNAEVISSLGDALASVREEIERASGEVASLEELVRMAEDAAIRAGADPQSVQVVTERDEERGTVRAVATGNVALAAAVQQAEVSESEARAVAAYTSNARPDSISLLADTGGFWVYQIEKRGLRLFSKPLTVVIDRRGTVRLSLRGVRVISGLPDKVRETLHKEIGGASDTLGSFLGVRLLIGTRLLDLVTGGQSNDVVPAAEAALTRADGEARVVAIIER
jgi:putative intracellular protease/amidase